MGAAATRSRNGAGDRRTGRALACARKHPIVPDRPHRDAPHRRHYVHRRRPFRRRLPLGIASASRGPPASVVPATASRSRNRVLHPPFRPLRRSDPGRPSRSQDPAGGSHGHRGRGRHLGRRDRLRPPEPGEQFHFRNHPVDRAANHGGRLRNRRGHRRGGPRHQHTLDGDRYERQHLDHHPELGIRVGEGRELVTRRSQDAPARGGRRIVQLGRGPCQPRASGGCPPARRSPRGPVAPGAAQSIRTVVAGLRAPGLDRRPAPPGGRHQRTALRHSSRLPGERNRDPVSQQDLHIRSASTLRLLQEPSTK